MSIIEDLFLDFELVHQSGDRLYPVRIKNSSGQMTYRWFHHGNENAESRETNDSNEIVSRVLSGKGIRCSSTNGKRKGIYKLTGSSIVRFLDKRG